MSAPFDAVEFAKHYIDDRSIDQLEELAERSEWRACYPPKDDILSRDHTTRRWLFAIHAAAIARTRSKGQQQ